MSNSNLYSYHTFLFPFQWQFVGKEMINETLEKRTELKRLIEMFTNQSWERGKYEIDTVLRYNEYNYFYNMVRDVLFDKGEPLEKAIVANLMYKIKPDTCYYNFTVCIDAYKNEYKSYSLHIDSIILHLYSTGVGVLSFHLNNRLENQKEPGDILNINQVGRRFYPPFFGIESHLVGTQAQFECADFEKGLNIVKTKELGVNISVVSDLNFEDFSTYSNPGFFNSNPFQIPRHISFLFEGIPLSVNKSPSQSNDLKVFINPLIDDRMFVLCWYGNDKIVKDLKLNGEAHGRDHDAKLVYQHDTWWYKFIFNDQKEPTCQNHEMRQKLIKDHTYTRWSDYGTLFGVTRYSFVCLTEDLGSLRNNNAHFLVNHMQTMYYKICELCLVQRACLLHFSDEVADISKLKDDRKSSLSDRVSNLYQQYLRFVNRIYFREITGQDQGIELYDMLQEHMRIDNNVKDLDREIQELYSYINLLKTNQTNKRMRLLSILGALILIPNFLLNLMGNRFFTTLSKPNSLQGLTIKFDGFLLVLVIVICSISLTYGLLKREEQIVWKLKGKHLIYFSIFVFLLYLLLYPFSIGKYLW